MDPVVVWAPSGRRLVSGLIALNLVLLGAAFVIGESFNPNGLKHQEPQVFILLLMGLSLLWILWYLFWTRRQPGISPHTDHHAGGIYMTVVLLVFTACSLLLQVFKMGYYVILMECKPTAKVLLPFVEAPFLGLQTYLLWAHSKDCIHRHKILTRAGLVLVLTTDLLLWLSAVTEDTVHLEIELEKGDRGIFTNTSVTDILEESDIGLTNGSLCQCEAQTVCRVFRKGYEVLYPFNIEYYLMAGCMVYVMWKNVGRHVDPHSHHHGPHKVTLRVMRRGGIIFGPLLGLLVLVVGIAIFILYQVWVSLESWHNNAFLLFYGFHLAIIPVMSFCTLTGIIIHKLEARAKDTGHNPTRNLDVVLLVAAALGQLAVSYFSLVASFAIGPDGLLGSMDLSYSLLSLLELVLQNIFIIGGLHRHPSLWVIPAFGAHPQFENELGKQFFGFSAWFVIVNLGQPLGVFYRMHSVAALLELLVSA
ncbi:OTOP3 protein, partial [Amia calva]|nr:OTOP3 protein [Amia calva]